jgi:hypothetical protein
MGRWRALRSTRMARPGEPALLRLDAINFVCRKRDVAPPVLLRHAAQKMKRTGSLPGGPVEDWSAHVVRRRSIRVDTFTMQI